MHTPPRRRENPFSRFLRRRFSVFTASLSRLSGLATVEGLRSTHSSQ